MSAHFEILAALVLYIIALSTLVIWSSRKVDTESDFIIGNRSLNFWLTAMAAHASDMSSWLFMAYPALIFVGGLFNGWVAIGLLICMWLNWQLVAKKFRVLTGKWNCMTFSSFLQHRYQDEKRWLQLLSAIFCFFFYVIYVCAGLTGLGLLSQTLFGISYEMSVLVGTLIVVSYVILGGFITLAWIDLVQGLFLLGVICLVPFMVMNRAGGWESVSSSWQAVEGHMFRFMPTTWQELLTVISLAFGWGLGYFGQPHIITKFMGIKNPEEITKSRNVGMTWMALSLFAATLVGLVALHVFSKGIADPQMIFVEMVRMTFRPFLVGLTLCAVIAATINVMSAQLLILSSILTEDVYKHFVKKKQSSKHLLMISRVWVVAAAVAAYAIAQAKPQSINTLVQYAWSGLGAAFGPLVLASLYSTSVNKYGAIAAIVIGGVVAGGWPCVSCYLPFEMGPLIPGFIASFVGIFLVSYLTRHRVSSALL